MDFSYGTWVINGIELVIGSGEFIGIISLMAPARPRFSNCCRVRRQENRIKGTDINHWRRTIWHKGGGPAETCFSSTPYWGVLMGRSPYTSLWFCDPSLMPATLKQVGLSDMATVRLGLSGQERQMALPVLCPGFIVGRTHGLS
jgi:hypothetical protein